MKHLSLITMSALSLFCTTALSMDKAPITSQGYTPIPQEACEVIIAQDAINRARARHVIHKAYMLEISRRVTDLETLNSTINTLISVGRTKNAALIAATNLQIEQCHQEDAQYERQ